MNFDKPITNYEISNFLSNCHILFKWQTKKQNQTTQKYIWILISLKNPNTAVVSVGSSSSNWYRQCDGNAKCARISMDFCLINKYNLLAIHQPKVKHSWSELSDRTMKQVSIYRPYRNRLVTNITTETSKTIKLNHTINQIEIEIRIEFVQWLSNYTRILIKIAITQNLMFAIIFDFKRQPMLEDIPVVYVVFNFWMFIVKTEKFCPFLVLPVFVFRLVWERFQVNAKTNGFIRFQTSNFLTFSVIISGVAH